MNRKIAVIVAHPDDEALGCGGTLLKHKYNGDELYFLWLTNGINSRDYVSCEDISIRNLGLKKAIELIEPNYYETKDFPDNQLDQVALLEITKSIEVFIDKTKPDTIYTHFYNDLNVDHQLVSRAVMTATRPGSNTFVKKIYAFETPSSTEWNYLDDKFTPDTFIDIEDVIEKKKDYLSCYSEEMKPFPHPRSYDNVRAMAQLRGATVNLSYAEAFVTLRRVISI